MLKRMYNKWVFFTLKDRVNIIKTVVINFMLLPFKQAIHFPIVLYGPCKLGCLTGKVIFSTKIHKGIIKIGVSDAFRSYFNKSYIEIKGVMRIGKGVILRRGMSLKVAETGQFSIENNVTIGTNGSIACFHSINICEATSIGNNSVIMDTDFHYTINTISREIKKKENPIFIGKNCWIASWCTIKKGAQLPNGVIVAGPYSIIGKNYIDKIPEYSLIAGSPAKLIKENIRRINNGKSQSFAYNRLMENDNFILPDGINIDTFCLPQT